MADEDSLTDEVKDAIDELFGDPVKPKGMIEAGKLYKNKQRIIEMIDKLEEYWGGNIPVEEIVNKAAEEEIGEEEVKATLDELVTDGYIERPRWMEGIIHKKGRHMMFCPWSQDLPG